MEIKSWAIVIISLIVVQVIVGSMFDFTVGKSPNVLSDKSVQEFEETVEGSKIDTQFNILEGWISGVQTES